jgi:hypothetical protein
MAPKAIGDGSVIDVGFDSDPRDDRVDDLERQLARVRGELSDARHELARVKEDSNRALTSLRQQLSPLYRALQRVFGELDAAGVPDAASPGPTAAGVPSPGQAETDPRIKAVWDSWKSRLSPACGKVIDALLLHGELNSVQLKVAARLGTSTVSDSISKLNKAGLVNKNGGRFSLKQL